MSESPGKFVANIGAVPDWFKLSSTIQTDPNGMWWKESRCDFCEYEASICLEGKYACNIHKAKIIPQKPETKQ